MVDKLKGKQLLLSTLAVAVALNSGISTAADASQSWALEEVVVTAQKRAESLQDVPVAVSAFGGDALNDFGVSGVKSIQLVTPSLVYNNTGAVGQAYLRGVGTRLANMGLEPSIATYVDDRYVSRASGGMFELADVERVEVLKGPQGTLYGRNATGGAIRVISKAPSEEFEGEIRASLGNENFQSASGTVSIPVTDDLRTRLTALIKRRDGFADNLSPVGPSELDALDFESYRAQVVWDITEDADMRLILGHWTRDDSIGNDVVALGAATLNHGIVLGGITGTKSGEVATTVSGDTYAKESSAQLRFNVSYDAFDFSSMTTYSDYINSRYPDADGTSVARADAFSTENAETYSQEFQLVSNAEGDFRWLAGTFFFHQEGTSLINIDASGLTGSSTLLSQSNQHVQTDSWAVFGEGTYDFNDQWSLTLGGRWNYEEKEVRQAAEPGTRSVVAVPFEDDDNWTSFTPKATLEYNMDLGMAYLTYSRGFKSGGFDYPSSGKQSLEPEVLDMIELGFKADLLEESLRLNTALFYYDYKDLQVSRASTGAGGGLTLSTENAANAEVTGLEVDLTWLPTENLMLTAGVSLLQSEYADYDASAKVYRPTGGMTDTTFDANGESLLRAPDFSGFVSAKYDLAIGEAMLPVVVTYSYKGEYDFDFVGSPLTEELTQEAYGLLSARVSYIAASEAWSVSLWGNNLIDEEYFDDVVANAAGLRGSYAEPRTYGVDLKFTF